LQWPGHDATCFTWGWVRPLDDLIPNFAQWQAAFTPGSLIEGGNIFKGKTHLRPGPDHDRGRTLCAR